MTTSNEFAIAATVVGSGHEGAERLRAEAALLDMAMSETLHVDCAGDATTVVRAADGYTIGDASWQFTGDGAAIATARYLTNRAYRARHPHGDLDG